MVQDTLLEPNKQAPPPDDISFDFPLGIDGFTYADLYKPERLRALAAVFYSEVARADASLHASLADYVSSRGEKIKGTKAESELLIAAAPHLSRFLARLFRVEREREELAARIQAQDPVFQFKQF